jgi:ABC-type thiamin/hydroxymethylpyrimidine transport system permease subunit
MQTARESLIESIVNVISGIVVAALLNYVLAPYFGVRMNAAQSVGLTLALTVASFIRSYLLRRAFNRRLMRRLHDSSFSGLS